MIALAVNCFTLKKLQEVYQISVESNRDKDQVWLKGAVRCREINDC